MDASYSGQMLYVYSSADNQQTFSYLNSCIAIGSVCTFSTPHFSDFTLLSGTDTVPDTFSFTPQTGVSVSSVVTSNAVVIFGINAATSVSTNMGSLIVDGTNVGSSATVYSGSSLAVQITSSSNYATVSTATVTVGGVTSAFTVTTLSATVSGG